MEDCANPLLGIKHHNRHLEQERRSSYIVEVWKGSYTVEAWMIVLIRCWVSCPIMILAPWKCGEVPTPWECIKGSYIVEAWMIVLIRCWVLCTIMSPVPWKREEVPTLWKYRKGYTVEA
nr:hypothetical protein CFP56_59166 [Quercus suber]